MSQAQLDATTVVSEARLQAVPAAPVVRRASMVSIATYYVAALAVAEALVVVADPRIAVGAHIILLTALITQATFTTDRARNQLYLSLSLAPMVRILSLSMPLGDVRIVYWYLLTGIPMIASALAAAFILKLNWRDMGFGFTDWPLQLEIALIGISLGACEYIILRPAPLVDGLHLKTFILPALILLFGTGVNEELVFRGVMQAAMRPALGKLSLVYVAAVFAILHLGYQSAPDLVFVFLVGFLFSVIVDQTRSLVGVSLSHGITNIMLFLVLPNIFG